MYSTLHFDELDHEAWERHHDEASRDLFYYLEESGGYEFGESHEEECERYGDFKRMQVLSLGIWKDMENFWQDLSIVGVFG